MEQETKGTENDPNTFTIAQSGGNENTSPEKYLVAGDATQSTPSAEIESPALDGDKNTTKSFDSTNLEMNSAMLLNDKSFAQAGGLISFSESDESSEDEDEVQNVTHATASSAPQMKPKLTRCLSIRYLRGGETLAFKYLQKVQGESFLFYGLSYSELRDLAAEISVLEIDRGETLFRQGDAASFVIIMLDGEAEVRMSGELVSVLSSGDVAGEFSLFAGGRRHAQVAVSSETALVGVMLYQDLPKLYAKRPELGLRFMGILGRAARYHALERSSQRLGTEDFPGMKAGPETVPGWLKSAQAVHEALGPGLSEEELEVLNQQMVVWELKAEDTALLKGRKGNVVIIVLEGALEARASDGAVLRTFNEGRVVGARPFVMLDFSLHAVREHNLVGGASGAVLGVWSHSTLEHLAHSHPLLCFKLFLHLAGTCMDTQDRPLIQRHKSAGFPPDPPFLHTPSKPEEPAGGGDGGGGGGTLMTHNSSSNKAADSNSDSDSDEEEADIPLSQEDIREMLTYCKTFTQWYDTMTDSEVEKLSYLMLAIKANEGDPILCSLWHANAIHILLSGEAEMTGATREGLELEPGHWLGELEWCEPDRKWNSNIVATQSGTVVGVLPLSTLRDLHTTDPALGLKILRLACNCCWLNLAASVHHPVNLETRLPLCQQTGVMYRYRQALRRFFTSEDFTDAELFQITETMSLAEMTAHQMIVYSGEQLPMFALVLEGTVLAVQGSSSVETSYKAGDDLAPNCILAEEAVEFDHRAGPKGAVLLLLDREELTRHFLVNEVNALLGYKIIGALIANLITDTIGRRRKSMRKRISRKAENLVQNMTSLGSKPTARKQITMRGRLGLSRELLAVLLQDSVSFKQKVQLWMDAQVHSKFWRLIHLSEMKVIAKHFSVLPALAGKKLVKKGEPALFVGLILSGTATAFQDKQEVGTLLVGDFFGVQNFFSPEMSHGGRSLDIIADTDCQVGVFMHHKIMDLFEKDKLVAVKLMRLMSHMALDQLRVWTMEHKNEFEEEKQEKEEPSNSDSASHPVRLSEKLEHFNAFSAKFKAKWNIADEPGGMLPTEDELGVFGCALSLVIASPGELVVQAGVDNRYLFMVVAGEIREKRLDIHLPNSKAKRRGKQKDKEVQIRSEGDYLAEVSSLYRLIEMEDLVEEINWHCSDTSGATLLRLDVRYLIEQKNSLPTLYARILCDLGSMTINHLWRVYQVSYKWMHYCLERLAARLAEGTRHKRRSSTWDKVMEGEGQDLDLDLDSKVLHGLTFGDQEPHFKDWSSPMSDEKRSDLLRAVAKASRFWWGFQDQELQILAERMTIKVLDNGEYYSGPEDEMSLVVGILARGKAEAHLLSDEGNTQTLAKLYPGDLVGRMTMFQGGYKKVSYMSARDGTMILEMSAQNLSELLINHTQIAHKVITVFLRSALTLVKESVHDMQDHVTHPALLLPRDKLYKMLETARDNNTLELHNEFTFSEICKILRFAFTSRMSYGKTIYRKGDEGLSIALILDGEAEIRVDARNIGLGEQEEQVQDNINEWRQVGSWLGESCFTDTYMRRTTQEHYVGVGSISITLAVISIKKFQHLCLKFPAIGCRLLHQLTSSQVQKQRAALSQSIAVSHRRVFVELPGTIDPDAPKIEALLNANDKSKVQMAKRMDLSQVDRTKKVFEPDQSLEPQPQDQKAEVARSHPQEDLVWNEHSGEWVTFEELWLYCRVHGLHKPRQPSALDGRMSTSDEDDDPMMDTIQEDSESELLDKEASPAEHEEEDNEEEMDSGSLGTSDPKETGIRADASRSTPSVKLPGGKTGTYLSKGETSGTEAANVPATGTKVPQKVSVVTSSEVGSEQQAAMKPPFLPGGVSSPKPANFRSVSFADEAQQMSPGPNNARSPSHFKSQPVSQQKLRTPSQSQSQEASTETVELEVCSDSDTYIIAANSQLQAQSQLHPQLEHNISKSSLGDEYEMSEYRDQHQHQQPQPQPQLQLSPPQPPPPQLQPSPPQLQPSPPQLQPSPPQLKPSPPQLQPSPPPQPPPSPQLQPSPPQQHHEHEHQHPLVSETVDVLANESRNTQVSDAGGQDEGQHSSEYLTTGGKQEEDESSEQTRNLKPLDLLAREYAAAKPPPTFHLGPMRKPQQKLEKLGTKPRSGNSKVPSAIYPSGTSSLTSTPSGSQINHWFHSASQTDPRSKNEVIPVARFPSGTSIPDQRSGNKTAYSLFGDDEVYQTPKPVVTILREGQLSRIDSEDGSKSRMTPENRKITAGGNANIPDFNYDRMDSSRSLRNEQLPPLAAENSFLLNQEKDLQMPSSRFAQNNHGRHKVSPLTLKLHSEKHSPLLSSKSPKLRTPSGRWKGSNYWFSGPRSSAPSLSACPRDRVWSPSRRTLKPLTPTQASRYDSGVLVAGPVEGPHSLRSASTPRLRNNLLASHVLWSEAEDHPFNQPLCHSVQRSFSGRKLSHATMPHRLPTQLTQSLDNDNNRLPLLPSSSPGMHASFASRLQTVDVHRSHSTPKIHEAGSDHAQGDIVEKMMF